MSCQDRFHCCLLPRQRSVPVAQEDSISPFEEFERVFSKFASAEEVTGARVDDDAQEEAEEQKEDEAAKVRQIQQMSQ